MGIINLDIYTEKSNGSYTARPITAKHGDFVALPMNLNKDSLLGNIPLGSVYDPSFQPSEGISAFVQSLREWKNRAVDNDTVEVIGEGLLDVLPGKVRDLYNQV